MRGVIPYHEGLNPKEIYDFPVYHYTSPDGFKSIIENQTLRFSRYDCLNDYKDSEVAKELFPICLDEMLRDDEINRDYYEKYKAVNFALMSCFERGHSLYYVSGKPYICCFSMNQDSLQMWQYYTKGGNYEGYNIGFDLGEIHSNFYRFMRTGKVFYDKDIQKKNIKHSIKLIYDCDLENTKDYGKPFYSVDQLSSEIAMLGCFFKNKSYEGENEVRAVVIIPDDYQYREHYWQSYIECKEKYPDIKYRFFHGMMIPYFDLYFNKDCLKCITIGPITSNKDESAKKNKEIVGLFLYEQLERKIDLKVSNIPLRY